jgi:hypothetical protein
MEATLIAHEATAIAFRSRPLTFKTSTWEQELTGNKATTWARCAGFHRTYV